MQRMESVTACSAFLLSSTNNLRHGLKADFKYMSLFLKFICSKCDHEVRSSNWCKVCHLTVHRLQSSFRNLKWGSRQGMLRFLSVMFPQKIVDQNQLVLSRALPTFLNTSGISSKFSDEYFHGFQFWVFMSNCFLMVTFWSHFPTPGSSVGVVAKAEAEIHHLLALFRLNC